jgi:thiosulfate/3-mercaptopyruvate sulfurtransferase
MPNSVSIPFTSLLQTHKWQEGTYTTLLPPADLGRTLSHLLNSESDPRGENRLESILRGSQPVITSCGSGMTAAVVWLALQELGALAPIRLYDEVSTTSSIVGKAGWDISVI